MVNFQKVVLGVSLGTRYIGIALFQDRILIDWQIKVFKTAWTKSKKQSIFYCIHDIIVSEKVDIVAIKIPHESRQGQYLKKLISYLTNELKNHAINFCLYDIRKLKHTYLYNQKTNKSDLIQKLIMEHPQLITEYNKELKNKNHYYIKVFEAIASAKSCLLNM